MSSWRPFGNDNSSCSKLSSHFASAGKNTWPASSFVAVGTRRTPQKKRQHPQTTTHNLRNPQRSKRTTPPNNTQEPQNPHRRTPRVRQRRPQPTPRPLCRTRPRRPRVHDRQRRTAPRIQLPQSRLEPGTHRHRP
jgi:hypothetical protein